MKIRIMQTEGYIGVRALKRRGRTLENIDNTFSPYISQACFFCFSQCINARSDAETLNILSEEDAKCG